MMSPRGPVQRVHGELGDGADYGTVLVDGPDADGVRLVAGEQVNREIPVLFGREGENPAFVAGVIVPAGCAADRNTHEPVCGHVVRDLGCAGKGDGRPELANGSVVEAVGTSLGQDADRYKRRDVAAIVEPNAAERPGIKGLDLVVGDGGLLLEQHHPLAVVVGLDRGHVVGGRQDIAIAVRDAHDVGVKVDVLTLRGVLVGAVPESNPEPWRTGLRDEAGGGAVVAENLIVADIVEDARELDELLVDYIGLGVAGDLGDALGSILNVSDVKTGDDRLWKTCASRMSLMR